MPVRFGGGVLTDIVAIATGGYHSCALDAVGQVWCWGNNNEGALGDQTNTDSPIAKIVPGISNVIAITAGGFHSCALRADLSAMCWGRNANGQLGNGTTNDSNRPVRVSGLTGAVAISAGGFHTCAVRTDSSVVCWGMDNDGQLGDGTLGPAVNHTPSAPVVMKGTAGAAGPPLAASSVAASIGVGVLGGAILGGFHTCAVRTDGDTNCWGNDNEGQVTGIGAHFVNFGEPAAQHRIIFTNEPRTGLPTSRLVAAGAYHVCQLRVDAISCWGRSEDGELGGPSFVPVTGTAGAYHLAAGGFHTCAVLGQTPPGTVACWGNNGDGQVTGTPGSNLMTPVTLAVP